MRAWVGELDAAICAEPRLAELGGRFWFSLDDGRADVSGLGADVGVHVLDDGCALLLAGRDTGVRLAVGDVVQTLVGVAVRFIEVRGKAWRVNELDDTSGSAARCRTECCDLPAGHQGHRWAGSARKTAGSRWAPRCRWACCPRGSRSTSAAIEAPLVVTPWRSVLVCDLDEAVADAALRVLAPLGLVFDENSPWLTVSACTGSPGCAHSAADVRADAALSLRSGFRRASPLRRLRTRLRQPADRSRCWSPPDTDIGCSQRPAS